MVLNWVQGLKETSHEVSARKNNNQLRYNKKCWGARIPPPPPALLGLRTLYYAVKGCRMGRSDKVSLWYVALLINTRFPFFILE